MLSFHWLPQIKETDSKMAAANSFTVYAGNRLLVVAASSEMEKNKWMEDLQMVIDDPSNELEIDQLRYASLKSNSKCQRVTCVSWSLSVSICVCLSLCLSLSVFVPVSFIILFTLPTGCCDSF